MEAGVCEIEEIQKDRDLFSSLLFFKVKTSSLDVSSFPLFTRSHFVRKQTQKLFFFFCNHQCKHAEDPTEHSPRRGAMLLLINRFVIVVSFLFLLFLRNFQKITSR